MDGVLPSSSKAPSIWYDAVADPQRKSLGKVRFGLVIGGNPPVVPALVVPTCGDRLGGGRLAGGRVGGRTRGRQRNADAAGIGTQRGTDPIWCFDDLGTGASGDQD